MILQLYIGPRLLRDVYNKCILTNFSSLLLSKIHPNPVKVHAKEGVARTTQASHVSVTKHASEKRIAAMTIAPSVVRIHNFILEKKWL